MIITTPLLLVKQPATLASAALLATFFGMLAMTTTDLFPAGGWLSGVVLEFFTEVEVTAECENTFGEGHFAATEAGV